MVGEASKMACTKFEDVSALDWDDTELIKAYDRGMSLNVKKLEGDSAKEKQNSKRKWTVGNYCQAVYPYDNLQYEAKIVDVLGDTCIVNFLGYNEDFEVDVSSLTASKGKQARKKQIQEGKEYLKSMEEESASADDSHHDFSESHCKCCVRHEDGHFNNTNHMNGTANYTAGDCSFNTTMYSNQLQCCVRPMTTASVAIPPPPPPPLPQCPDDSSSASLTSMLTSWYMAGYYTGVHQSQCMQHQQRCFCANQRCHH